MISPARYGLQRWLLAPRTTWRARRLCAAHPQLSGDQAWALARLYRHPDEVLYAHGFLQRRDWGQGN
ncbi:hypothetical protein AB0C95_04675 [Streptomyces caniferus]|uniref:hypothetical protein n=1 Tax=Streptomyces caniferus TaxID=285557 RepID=UPI0033D91764